MKAIVLVMVIAIIGVIVRRSWIRHRNPLVGALRRLVRTTIHYEMRSILDEFPAIRWNSGLDLKAYRLAGCRGR
jgi:hypothetical protein